MSEQQAQPGAEAIRGDDESWRQLCDQLVSEVTAAKRLMREAGIGYEQQPLIEQVREMIESRTATLSDAPVALFTGQHRRMTGFFSVTEKGQSYVVPPGADVYVVDDAQFHPFARVMAYGRVFEVSAELVAEVSIPIPPPAPRPAWAGREITQACWHATGAIQRADDLVRLRG